MKIKKIISILLSMVMLLSITAGVDFSAFAATSGWCGDNAKWSYNSSTKTLTISGTGAMYDYCDDAPWSNIEGMKYIVINSGITSVGEDNFAFLRDVESVTLPNTLTTIGNDAFAESSFTSVNLSNGLKHIGKYAFCGIKISNIDLPETVTTIGEGAFSLCYYLKSVYIPTNVTSIGKYVFDGCESLSSITVDANNKYYCSKNGILYNKTMTVLMRVPLDINLTSITIPNTVKFIENNAFKAQAAYGGYQSVGFGKTLKKVVIPNSVTKIGNFAFYGCEALSSLTMSKNVISIGKYAFSNNIKLTSVVLPNTVTSVGSGCFENCKSLTKLVLSSSLKKIPTEFAFGCTKLKSIFIPSSVTSIAKSSLGRYYDKNGNYKTISGFIIYSKNNKYAKSYAGNYKGITHKNVSVPSIKLKSLSAVTAGFKATWAKNTKMSGYQIQYSTSSKFTSPKYVYEDDQSKASKTVTGLTASKKYYVRIRNYKYYAGAKVYGSWSSAKTVTTKK